jgi:hypothetical protein
MFIEICLVHPFVFFFWIDLAFSLLTPLSDDAFMEWQDDGYL